MCVNRFEFRERKSIDCLIESIRRCNNYQLPIAGRRHRTCITHNHKPQQHLVHFRARHNFRFFNKMCFRSDSTHTIANDQWGCNARSTTHYQTSCHATLHTPAQYWIDCTILCQLIGVSDFFGGISVLVEYYEHPPEQRAAHGSPWKHRNQKWKQSRAYELNWNEFIER